MLPGKACPRTHFLLIKRDVPFIFYPCIPYERKEVPGAGNHYNCPMVTSYSENIKNNMEELKEKNVKFLNPFMAFTSEAVLSKQLQEVFKKEFDIPESETKKAAKKAWMNSPGENRCGEERRGSLTVLKRHRKTRHRPCGTSVPHRSGDQPRHRDMITSYGFAVLTEDSVSHLGKVERPLVVTDQWMYTPASMRRRPCKDTG